MNFFIRSGISFLFFVTPLFAQDVYVHIQDADFPTNISGASITELASGQTAVTDSEGYATLPGPFAGGATLEFRVDALGYEPHFLSRKMFDDPGKTTLSVTAYLATPNQLVSPVVGPAGGSKSVSLPTGQFTWAFPGDPNPVEYYQDFEFTLPANALTQARKIGFTPKKPRARNNLNVISSYGEKYVLAEFSIRLLNLSGQMIPSPILASPIHIKMSADGVFHNELTDSTSGFFARFNTLTHAWDQVGVVGSGIDAEGNLWVDLDRIDGDYAFIAGEVSQAGGDCLYWRVVYDWPKTPPGMKGVALKSLTVNCAGGITGDHVMKGSIKTNIDLNTESAKTFEASGLMDSIGYSQTGATSAGMGYTATHDYNDTYSDGAYEGDGVQGYVEVRTMGFTIDYLYSCLTYPSEGPPVWGPPILDHFQDVVTGTMIYENFTSCP